jgi:hypothetical protein
METHDILYKLTCFSKRLATLADQTQEIREQAQHTLDRLYLLREDIEQFRRLLQIEWSTEMESLTMSSEQR